MVYFDEDKQRQKLEEMRIKEEIDLAAMLADKYNLPYKDLTTVSVEADALRLVPEKEAREGKVAAFAISGKNVSLGVLSPASAKTEMIIKTLADRGFNVSSFLVTSHGLEKAWNFYKDLSFAHETKAGVLDISNEEIHKVMMEVKTLDDVKNLIDGVLKMKKSFRISRILEIMLAGSIATAASDIHVEPEEKYVRLRFRLDGVLIDVLMFDRETFGLILSRIKLLSGLKLNVKKDAQDGRFTIRIEDSDIEIRTSILPGAYGESVVLRILNPKSISVPMEELGIEPVFLSVLEEEIKRPNGMILTTGPTGSGKTTTLYAFLRKIHSPKIKIITIEDPIEYHLPGIVQTQTDEAKGYTFSQGLRSALRQDPDVIMVGEIRDKETAEIAINAALTGHLVFSTLHTNTAAGSFPRLVDLDINPKVLGSAINFTIAQRLVRKLCPDCRQKIPFTKEEQVRITSILEHMPRRAELTKNLSAETGYKAVGCQVCNNTGYRGRIGVYEGIKTDEKIENIVKEAASERDIATAARAQGLLTMAEDGVVKVLSGITTLEELSRVIDL